MSSWTRIPPPEWLETDNDVARAAEYLYNSTMAGNPLGFDTETTGLHIAKDIPLLLSLSDGHRRFACHAEHARDRWVQEALLANPQIIKTGTNLNFDRHMLANIGVQTVGIYHETLVMDWLANENRAHGLKETAKDHIGLQMKGFKEVFPMRKGTAKVPAETPGDAIRRVMADPELRLGAIEYSGLDAYASVQVHNFLMERLREQGIREAYTLLDYFYDWEVPFTPVLFNMERRGFTIMTGHLRAQMAPMEMAMRDLETTLAQMAGWVVNLNSPKQLQRLFFEQLRMRPIKYTDGGTTGVKQPSTDDSVLSEWILLNDPIAAPFARIIQEYRGISKIYGTYVEGLLGWVDNNLRIHTTLNQQGTVTGRLSSSDPNLQNIPKPKTDKYKIRDAFVAAPGKRLVIADYDQLEMKIMAHYSGDERMIAAIRDGKDLHCATVEFAKGIPYADVYAAKKASDAHTATDAQLELVVMRDYLKATGFGIIYGIGGVKLGGQLKLPVLQVPNKRGGGSRKICPEADKLIHDYLQDIYPGVGEFIRQTHGACREVEYVQTLLGRKRRLHGINISREDRDNRGLAAEAERQAVNTIIQGTAADIAKAAMLQVEHDEELHSLGAEMLMQIHDELILEVDDKPALVDATKKRLKALMTDPFRGYNLRVPLTAGVGEGYSWTEAK